MTSDEGLKASADYTDRVIGIVLMTFISHKDRTVPITQLLAAVTAIHGQANRELSLLPSAR